MFRAGKAHPSLEKVLRSGILWITSGKFTLPFSAEMETYGWWNCAVQIILSTKFCLSLFIEHISVLPLCWPVTACSANSATDSDDSLHPFSVSYQVQQDFPVLTGMVL